MEKTNTVIKQVNLVPYKKSISLIEQKANALTIKTEIEIKSASDILFQISEVQKRVKAEKEKITKPAKEIIAWAKATFGPIEDQCDEAEAIIKGKMVKFDEIKQKIAQKKLQDIADKVASGKMDLEKASEKIENIAPAKSYEGDVGSVQFRPHKVIVITDETKIPRKYLSPNLVLIRADATRGVSIPGVEVKIEKIVARLKL